MTAPQDPAVRWLTEREQGAWRSFLEAITLVGDAVEKQLQSDSKLSHADYEILVRLSEQPTRSLRMSDLAKRTFFSRSRLSHAVGRLEREGWVYREPSPGDKRGQLAVLTDRGYDLLASAAPGHVDAVRAALLDPLSAKQVEQLAAITSAIVAAAHARTS